MHEKGSARHPEKIHEKMHVKHHKNVHARHCENMHEKMHAEHNENGGEKVHANRCEQMQEKERVELWVRHTCMPRVHTCNLTCASTPHLARHMACTCKLPAVLCRASPMLWGARARCTTHMLLHHSTLNACVLPRNTSHTCHPQLPNLPSVPHALGVSLLSATSCTDVPTLQPTCTPHSTSPVETAAQLPHPALLLPKNPQDRPDRHPALPVLPSLLQPSYNPAPTTPKTRKTTHIPTPAGPPNKHRPDAKITRGVAVVGQD